MRVRIAKAMLEYLKKLLPSVYCTLKYLKICNKSEGGNDEEYFITFRSSTEQNLKL
jgi:hypothetical protein